MALRDVGGLARFVDTGLRAFEMVVPCGAGQEHLRTGVESAEEARTRVTWVICQARIT